MKAKTLLIAAATLAVGAITSQAQVYSQNVVGYINLTLTNNFNLICNQLDLDGSGTNNTVQTVFGTNLPAPSSVFAWVPSSAGYSSATWSSGKSGTVWSGNTNAVNKALSTGGAVFVKTPAGTGGSYPITMIGNVIQGTNVVPLAAGFNLAAPVSPVGGVTITNLGYVPHVGDTVFSWNVASQSWSSAAYSSSKSGAVWSPAPPTINVGQGVFVNASAATATSGWTNTLVIQ